MLLCVSVVSCCRVSGAPASQITSLTFVSSLCLETSVLPTPHQTSYQAFVLAEKMQPKLNLPQHAWLSSGSNPIKKITSWVVLVMSVL